MGGEEGGGLVVQRGMGALIIRGAGGGICGCWIRAWDVE